MINPNSFVRKIKEMNPMTSQKARPQREAELGVKIPGTNMYKFKTKPRQVGGGASKNLTDLSVGLSKIKNK